MKEKKKGYDSHNAVIIDSAAYYAHPPAYSEIIPGAKIISPGISDENMRQQNLAAKRGTDFAAKTLRNRKKPAAF